MDFNRINTGSVKWSEVASDLNSNFEKASTEFEKLKNATTRNKGYFASSDLLISSFPTANVGDIAYVGEEYPFQIWKWSGSSWVNTNITGGSETVELNNYYTKDEADEEFVKSRVFDGGRADSLYGGARTIDCGRADL